MNTKLVSSTNKEQLHSILALNKLCNIAKEINGDWMPDHAQRMACSMFSITINIDNSIKIIGRTSNQRSEVYFKSRDLALEAISILGIQELHKALTLNH